MESKLLEAKAVFTYDVDERWRAGMRSGPNCATQLSQRVSRILLRPTSSDVNSEIQDTVRQFVTFEMSQRFVTINRRTKTSVLWTRRLVVNTMRNLTSCSKRTSEKRLMRRAKSAIAVCTSVADLIAPNTCKVHVLWDVLGTVGVNAKKKLEWLALVVRAAIVWVCECDCPHHLNHAMSTSLALRTEIGTQINYLRHHGLVTSCMSVAAHAKLPNASMTISTRSSIECDECFDHLVEMDDEIMVALLKTLPDVSTAEARTLVCDESIDGM